MNREEEFERLARWVRESCPKFEGDLSSIAHRREVVLVIEHEMFGPVQFQLLTQKFPELSLIIEQRQKHHQELEEALRIESRNIDFSMPKKESDSFEKKRSYPTRKEKSRLPKWMR